MFGPFAADSRFAADTAFIVLEPDFIFYHQQEEQRQAWIDEAHEASAKLIQHDEIGGHFLSAYDQKRFKAALAEYRNEVLDDGGAVWGAKADGSPSEWTLCGTFSRSPEAEPSAAGDGSAWDTQVYQKRRKPRRREFDNASTSMELRDILAYLCCASRCGKGGLNWMGWSASHHTDNAKRKASPSTGAHLVVVTSGCMRLLLPKWQNHKDEQMGNMLNHIGREWSAEIGGASYVQKPIGGFMTHISTTSDKKIPDKKLHNHFKAPWAQEGTRKLNDDQQHRWVCGFTSKGHPQYLEHGAVELPLRSEELLWRTEPPPGMAEVFTGVQSWHKGQKAACRILFFYFCAEPLAARFFCRTVLKFILLVWSNQHSTATCFQLPWMPSSLRLLAFMGGTDPPMNVSMNLEPFL